MAAALAACGPARIETDPASVQLFGRGQKATVHAVPMSKGGAPMSGEACRWSSSDEKVATVSARHNEATVTAAGHGRAVIRCQVGGAAAEVPVAVTLVARVDAQPSSLELRLLDEPAPRSLTVRAFDGEGREVQGRAVLSRCLDENVCRGDARGQLWPVGPGDTSAVVEVDDGHANVAVHVVDARSAAGRPQRVAGNPMEHLDESAPGAAPGGKRGGLEKQRRTTAR
jgi:hypothetical protein